MKRVLLVSASALAIVTGSAFAADVIPEPVPEPTWTGFHIGIGGGAGYNFYDASSEVIDDDGGEQFMSIEGDDLGAFYGFGTVEAGFDFQFVDSPFVIGILANYDFNGNSSADAEAFTDDDDGDLTTESRIEAEIDDTWFVGGRLGFADENTLFYGLGGYTWADANVKSFHVSEDDGDINQFTEFDEDESVDGWTIGAGVEHMFNEFFSLKVEYRHDFLDSVDFDETVFDDGDQVNIDEDSTHDGEVDFSRDTIRAVLSWRFNPGW